MYGIYRTGSRGFVHRRGVRVTRRMSTLSKMTRLYGYGSVICRVFRNSTYTSYCFQAWISDVT